MNLLDIEERVYDGGTQQQSQVKNVENPGLKSTPGESTSLRSATPFVDEFP
jgi:hypothetical protein